MRMVEQLQEKFVKNLLYFLLFCRHIDLKYIRKARNFLLIILYSKDIVLNECASITKLKKIFVVSKTSLFSFSLNFKSLEGWYKWYVDCLRKIYVKVY